MANSERKIMHDYLDSVTGIYPKLDDAHQVAQQLIEQGISRDQIQVAAARTDGIEQDEDNKEVLKNVVIDGVVGTTVGAGVGALGQIAIVAANVSLFVASPLVAPLFMIGWGAVIGGFIGAGRGMANHDNQFSKLMSDAVKQGYAVLVVNAKTEAEVELARTAVTNSMQQFAKEENT